MLANRRNPIGKMGSIFCQRCGETDTDDLHEGTQARKTMVFCCESNWWTCSRDAYAGGRDYLGLLDPSDTSLA